jgi:hypothetical protein
VEAFPFGGFLVLDFTFQRETIVHNVEVQVLFAHAWDLRLHHDAVIGVSYLYGRLEHAPIAHG